MTLATSYAFGDVFGAKHSLNRGPLDAKLFYATFTAMVLAAAGIVLIPGAPLGLITTSVQALAGVLLPSATVFLLLLCNDREVLGPWSNPSWLNAIASVIIGVLVELSLILMVSTVFPTVNVASLFVYLTAVLLVVLVVVGLVALRNRPQAKVEVQKRVPSERRAHLDDAAARAAGAAGVVARAQGGDAAAARLPGPRRAAADREDRPARH